MIDLDAMQMFKYQCSLKMCVSEKYNIASELTNENVLAGGVCTQDAGPGTGSGLEQVVEAVPGSDRAEGLVGGHAGSGGRGVAS